MNFIKRMIGFFKRKEPTNGLVGYWGVVDTTNNTSEILGEMYSYEGKWIAGPKLKG